MGGGEAGAVGGREKGGTYAAGADVDGENGLGRHDCRLMKKVR